MDVQKTMEFLLEQQARFDAQMEQLTGKMEQLTGKIEQLTGKIEQLTGTLDQLTERQLQSEELREHGFNEINAVLRSAIRLSIEEQRRERVRRRELDTKVTQLASAQLTTEEKLQRLIDSLNQPRNGH